MRKAWVIGTYGNNGGNHMNYHIAKICKDTFGLETCAVGLDTSIFRSDNIFNHTKEFEEYSLKDFFSLHKESDILISNPSFSNYLLGYRAKCKKIMYVQHYNTFRRLDLKFDHYVAVSDFVKNYLRQVYSISAHKISAFTEPPDVVTPFEEKSNAILVYSKNRQARLNYFNRSGIQYLNDKKLAYLSSGINRKDFLNTIDSHKYLLTLSIDEGFGLVSMEAMNRGSVVFGFDGFGGRDYMIRSYNCMISKYPDWESVYDSVNSTVGNKKICNDLTMRAISTAKKYNFRKFEKSWIQLLERTL